MLGLEQLSLPVQVAAVVIPAALYFLLLGLLNSQRTPQLLRARTDFILMVLAFFPIFAVPVLQYVGASAWTVLGMTAVVAAAAVLLAPGRKGHWVVYNLSLPEALRSVERALQAGGESFDRRGRSLVLRSHDVTVKLSCLPMLRNVTISLDGRDAAKLHPAFERTFADELGRLQAQTTPMAATFLLISTLMLTTPLAVVANRMPEMVRLIGDLVK